MASQDTVVAKKRKGPAPTGKGTPVMVRLQPDQLALLDEWIAGRPDPKPSRPEAVRQHLAWSLQRTSSRIEPRSTIPNFTTGKILG